MWLSVEFWNFMLFVKVLTIFGCTPPWLFHFFLMATGAWSIWMVWKQSLAPWDVSFTLYSASPSWLVTILCCLSYVYLSILFYFFVFHVKSMHVMLLIDVTLICACHLNLHTILSEERKLFWNNFAGRMWCHCRMVYLPMSYLYGKRFVGPITPTVLALRKELYTLPYHEIEWNQARNQCAKVGKGGIILYQ